MCYFLEVYAYNTLLVVLFKDKSSWPFINSLLFFFLITSPHQIRSVHSLGIFVSTYQQLFDTAINILHHFVKDYIWYISPYNSTHNYKNTLFNVEYKTWSFSKPLRYMSKYLVYFRRKNISIQSQVSVFYIIVSLIISSSLSFFYLYSDFFTT